MYISVWEFVRPTEAVDFPPGDERLNRLRATAPGFIGKETIFDDSGLVKKIKTKWASEENAINFLLDNEDIVINANTNLIAYCDVTNITATRFLE